MEAVFWGERLSSKAGPGRKETNERPPQSLLPVVAGADFRAFLFYESCPPLPADPFLNPPLAHLYIHLGISRSSCPSLFHSQGLSGLMTKEDQGTCHLLVQGSCAVLI